MMCCLVLISWFGHTGESGTRVSLFMVAGSVLVVLTLVAVVVAAVTSRTAARRREADGTRRPDDPAREVIACTAAKPTLLTPGELLFFRMLEPLVSPRCLVFAKVRLADLFSVDDCTCRQSATAMLSGKRIDFVLCDPSSSGVMAAIELDENAPEGSEQEERERFIDDLFASNGLPLIRVPEGANEDDESLRQSLRQSLARHDLLPARAGDAGRRRDLVTAADV